MRHTAAIIAGSVVAALATGGILTVSGGAQTPGATAIKLVTKNCSYKSIDIPPRSRGRNSRPGPGDGYTGSCPAFDSSGTRAGVVDLACLMPRGVRRGASALCHGAYSLAGGDLHLVARANDDDRVSGAITGGTATYAGARGTFTSIDQPGAGERNGYPKDDTITLLP